MSISTVFNLAKSYVIGNPLVIAAIAAGVVLYSAFMFGMGYERASDHYHEALLNSQQAILQAVDEKRIAQHETAIALGRLIEARRAGQVATLKAILDKIDNTKIVTQACALTPEAIDILNEAGK